MSDLLNELTHRAKELAPEERAQLAEVMLESLRESTPADVESAWDRELAARIAGYERGEALLISSQDVFAEARRLTR